jgi:hypothetical protein
MNVLVCMRIMDPNFSTNIQILNPTQAELIILRNVAFTLQYFAVLVLNLRDRAQEVPWLF